MAKSIFEILADLTTETSVPEMGKTIEHTIPRKLFPEPETFDNAEKLLAWAEENNYTHALLQMGLQKGLIDVRAKYKSCKKNDTWTPEYGQANVDAHEWETTERPNAADNKKVSEAVLAVGRKMVDAMRATGQPEEIIFAALAGVYGEAVTKELLKK